MIQIVCVACCVVWRLLPSCYDPIAARINCGRMGVWRGVVMLMVGGERRKFFPGILCCCWPVLCCAARLLCKHNGRHLLHLGKQGTRTLTTAFSGELCKVMLPVLSIFSLAYFKSSTFYPMAALDSIFVVLRLRPLCWVCQLPARCLAISFKGVEAVKMENRAVLWM